MLTVFRYIKVTYHRIVLPVRSAGAMENVPCSIAFLTMVITIPTGINSGWNILDWSQNKIRNVEMVCSRTVVEQTIIIFLKLSYNHSKYLLEKYWDTYRNVAEQTIKTFLELF